MRVCPECWDVIPRRQSDILDLQFGTPRANSSSLDAVNNPVTFSITAAAGITPSHSLPANTRTQSADLGISNVPDNVFFGTAYYMLVQGSGSAVDITANPQIVGGVKGDTIVLEGASDTNTVTLDTGDGLILTSSSFVLGDGDTIGLARGDTTWVEVSRTIKKQFA